MIFFSLLTMLTPEGLKYYIIRRMYLKISSVQEESEALKNERRKFLSKFNDQKLPLKRIPFL
jgi:hypothetical protein